MSDERQHKLFYNVDSQTLCIRICKGPSCSARSKDQLESWFAKYRAITEPNSITTRPVFNIEHAYCFGLCFKGPNAAFYRSRTAGADQGNDASLSTALTIAATDSKGQYQDICFEHHIKEKEVDELITYHARRLGRGCKK